MAQIFHRSTNTLSRLTIYLSLILVGALLMVTDRIQRSGYITSANVVVEQPVPFSHKYHVADDGIDCRYCHTSVEDSSFAGIPPTRTCMNCHSLLFANSPFLGTRRASYRPAYRSMESRPQAGRFRLFRSQHSHREGHRLRHVATAGSRDAAGAPSRLLQMEWCIDCHRQPENICGRRIRCSTWRTKPRRIKSRLGLSIKKDYHIRSAEERRRAARRATGETVNCKIKSRSIVTPRRSIRGCSREARR